MTKDTISWITIVNATRKTGYRHNKIRRKIRINVTKKRIFSGNYPQWDRFRRLRRNLLCMTQQMFGLPPLPSVRIKWMMDLPSTPGLTKVSRLTSCGTWSFAKRVRFIATVTTRGTMFPMEFAMSRGS